MESARVAHVIRRFGLKIAGLSRFFVPAQEDLKFFNKLMKEAQWQHKLEQLTDKEIAIVCGWHPEFQFAFGTKAGCIMTEIVTRLHRSQAGANRSEDYDLKETV